MYTHPFYLEEIEWALPHLLLFFSCLRTHEYTHPSDTSVVFRVHFVLKYFFWPLFPSFMTSLPPSNGKTFSDRHFPPAYTIFQVGNREIYQSHRESLWQVGCPAAALVWIFHKWRWTSSGVSLLPPLASFANLCQWSKAWVLQCNPWILQLLVQLWNLPRID